MTRKELRLLLRCGWIRVYLIRDASTCREPLKQPKTMREGVKRWRYKFCLPVALSVQCAEYRMGCYV